MLTFSKLSKKGNLGNHLFHIASTIGLASKHQQTYSFPEWQYKKYFEFEFPKVPENIDFNYLKEKQYHHYEWDLKEGNYDIEGWLQSEKYFDIPLTKEIFRFKSKFLENLKQEYKYLFDKKNILITVRRGDFIHHPFYYQLSYKFYFLALIRSFPDWEDRNLILTSDNIAYCKLHFGHLPNAYFIDKLSGIEQLALGSQCDDYIISNSTFSWWVAWLGEKKGTRVIRPFKKFRGYKSLLSDERDFFPERWIIFEHKGKKIPRKYIRLFLKGEAYLFGKFIYNKLRGMKYRVIRFPGKMKKLLN
jgi:hypothetical protein